MVKKMFFVLFGAFLVIDVAYCQRQATAAKQLAPVDPNGIDYAAIEAELAQQTAILNAQNGSKYAFDTVQMAALEKAVFSIDVSTADTALSTLTAYPDIQSLAKQSYAITAQSLDASAASMNQVTTPQTKTKSPFYFNWVKKFILASVVAVKAVITNVLAAIKNIISKVGPIIKWLLEKLKRFITNLLNLINQLVFIIQSTIPNICGTIKQIISILDTILPIISMIGNLLGNSSLGNSVRGLSIALVTVNNYVKGLAARFC